MPPKAKTKLPEPEKQTKVRRQRKVSNKDLKQIVAVLKEIRDILDNMWRERRPT